jgi:trigger factor
MSDSAVADNPDLAEGEATDSFEYPVEITDAGPSTKRVTVTVPGDHIKQRISEVFGEVRDDVVVPGFRRGKAPRHLIEKKFSKAVRDQVQGEVIRESYQQALEKNDLAVIGEPEFEDAEKIELPAEGDLTYSFTVEVRPEFALPEVGELTVKKPKIVIKDEHVDQALENLRQQQGALIPVEDRAVEAGDYLVADVVVKADDQEVAKQPDAQLVARSGRIAGVTIEDFGDRVAGMKPGETRTITVTAPETAPEQVRGKELSIELALKDLKALQKAEIDGPFLESLGFENKDELMAALREQMEERVEQDVATNLRRQVSEFLVANTQFDLPGKMTERQTAQVVNRRAMNLLMRGMAEAQVRESIEQIKQGADAEADKELRAFFILDKVATEMDISVDEAEINGQIAALAMERGERPEAVKQKMAKEGGLQNLFLATRERKTLDALLEKVKVEEVEPTPEQTKEAVEAVAPSEDDADDDNQDVT